MKLELFAIYDTAAKVYRGHQFHLTTSVAVRSFKTLVNSEGNDINMVPSDYVLFRLGYTEDDSGAVVPERAPVKIVTALELVDQPFSDPAQIEMEEALKNAQ